MRIEYVFTAAAFMRQAYAGSRTERHPMSTTLIHSKIVDRRVRPGAQRCAELSARVTAAELDRAMAIKQTNADRGLPD